MGVSAPAGQVPQERRAAVGVHQAAVLVEPAELAVSRRERAPAV